MYMNTSNLEHLTLLNEVIHKIETNAYRRAKQKYSRIIKALKKQISTLESQQQRSATLTDQSEKSEPDPEIIPSTPTKVWIEKALTPLLSPTLSPSPQSPTPIANRTRSKTKVWKQKETSELEKGVCNIHNKIRLKKYLEPDLHNKTLLQCTEQKECYHKYNSPTKLQDQQNSPTTTTYDTISLTTMPTYQKLQDLLNIQPEVFHYTTLVNFPSGKFDKAYEIIDNIISKNLAPKPTKYYVHFDTDDPEDNEAPGTINILNKQEENHNLWQKRLQLIHYQLKS